MLSWTYGYAGSEKDRVSADSRRQHTCSGDDVYDDELGKGVLDKLVGDTLYGYAIRRVWFRGLSSALPLGVRGPVELTPGRKQC